MPSSTEQSTDKIAPCKCWALTLKGTRCRRNQSKDLPIHAGVCNQHKDYFFGGANRFDLFNKHTIDDDEFRAFNKLITDKLIKTKPTHIEAVFMPICATDDIPTHLIKLSKDKFKTLTLFDLYVVQLKETHPVQLYNALESAEEIRAKIVNAYAYCEKYDPLVFNIHTMMGEKLACRINRGRLLKYGGLKREIINQHYKDQELEVDIALFAEGNENELFAKSMFTFLQPHQLDILTEKPIFCLPSTDKRPTLDSPLIFNLGDKVIYSSGYAFWWGVVAESPKDDHASKAYVYVKGVYKDFDPETKLWWADWDRQTGFNQYVFPSAIKRVQRWDSNDEVLNTFFNGGRVDAVELKDASANDEV